MTQINRCSFSNCWRYFCFVRDANSENVWHERNNCNKCLSVLKNDESTTKNSQTTNISDYPE